MSFLENMYDETEEENINSYAVVISEKIEKDYSFKYEVKLLKNNKKFLLYINKNRNSEKLKYGDLIYIDGKIEKVSAQRNYKGFNYELYLKTQKIYGKINANGIEIVKKEYKHSIINELQKYIKNNIRKNLNETEGNLLISILIGDKSYLSKEVIENFRNSDLSHILAVSGLHISYIILGLTYLLKILNTGNIKGKTIIFIVLFIFMAISNFTPSVTRAVIMTGLTIISSIIHRKSDTYTNLFISGLIILVLNPYSLYNLGFQLSFVRNYRNINI